MTDDFMHIMNYNKTEQRVAELMYNGLTYKAIADKLVVSYHTVKKHVQNIYTKCGVNSRFELYKWLENKNIKIVKPPDPAVIR